MKQCQPVSAIANETEEKKTREWPRVRIACVATCDVAAVLFKIAAVCGVLFALSAGWRWVMLPHLSEEIRDGHVFFRCLLGLVFSMFCFMVLAMTVAIFQEVILYRVTAWWTSVKKRAAGR